jgi:hypothetical protein
VTSNCAPSSRCRYERRLLLEIDRFNRLQADKVDASYAHDEKLRTLEEAHRKVCALSATWTLE